MSYGTLQLNAQITEPKDTVVNLDSEKHMHQKHKENHLKFRFDYDLGSVLNNAFLRKFLYGGTIDQKLIDENYDRLQHGPNHIGNTMDFAIQYRRFTGEFLGMHNVGFSTAIEWHLHHDFDFTDDGYSLIMNGNKSFAGKTADLSNTKYNFLQYSQIKLGLFKENEEKHSEYGFQLALNIGNQFEEFAAPHAQLYTDSLGEFVELEGEFEYLESGYIGKNSGLIQGIGAGLDLFYEIEKEHKYKFVFEVANIGFIYWNDNSLEYEAEEHYVFEGIVIDNLFDMPEQLYSTTVNDSLHDYIIANGHRGSHATLTPIELDIWYEHYLTEKISAKARFRHKIFGLYSPYYQLGGTYHISDKYHIGVDANYGGYSKLNFGVSLCMEINDNFVVDIRTRYLMGFLGHKFSGIGGFAQINYKF
ncbi:MAG: hypothetical protein KAG84_01880 [Bacteroidales bacterium]|nr:hypothetical protein [Bacteroidales bacterium]